MRFLAILIKSTVFYNIKKIQLQNNNKSNSVPVFFFWNRNFSRNRFLSHFSLENKILCFCFFFFFFFWYRRHIRQNFRYFHWKFYFQGKTYLNFLEILNLIWEILIHKPYSGKFFMVKWIRYSCWKVGKISKKYQKIPKNLEPEYRSLGTCIQGKKNSGMDVIFYRKNSARF